MFDHENIWEAYYMNPRTTRDEEAARRRRRSVNAIKESMRELSVQLSRLNHQVGAHLDLKEIDLSCLDTIARHGPLSPSALARSAGLHPATVTGILDRLERGAGSPASATRPTAAPSSSAPSATAAARCSASTRA